LEQSRVRVYGAVLAVLVALAAALAVHVLLVLVWPGTPFDLSWQFEIYCAFVAGLVASVMATHTGGDLADATLATLAMAFITFVVGVLLYPIALSTFSGRDAFGYQSLALFFFSVPALLLLVLPSAVWVVLLRLCVVRYHGS
jgi:hypothetical protein